MFLDLGDITKCLEVNVNVDSFAGLSQHENKSFIARKQAVVLFGFYFA